MTHFAVRRFINRMSHQMRAMPGKKQTTSSAPARQATPRKQGFRIVLMLFLAAVFLFQGVSLSTQFISRVLAEAGHEEDGRIVVPDHTFRFLLNIERESASVRPSAGPSARADSSERAQIRRRLKRVLERQNVPADELDQRLDKMMRVFESSGSAGFRPGLATPRMIPSSDLWPAPARSPSVIRCFALVLTALGFVLLLMMLSGSNQDLGKVEWSLTWLFTLPVRARVLFLARIVEWSVVNPLNWFIIFPFIFVLFICAGWGILGALVAAAGLSLYTGLMLASAYHIAETTLRKTVGAGHLKNIQAVVTVAGVVAFFGFFWVILRAPVSLLVETANRVPSAIFLNPFAGLVYLLNGTSPLLIAALAMTAAAVPYASLRITEWLVSDGLMGSSGAFQGVRRSTATGSSIFAWRPAGIIGKEVCLLLRDRNFLVQTMVLPLLMLGYNYLLIDHDMSSAKVLNFSAMAAFGVGAYVLMSSAFQVLASEGPALWLLCTVPKPLDRALLEKTKLWCGLAMVYAGAIIAFRYDTVGWVNALAALWGVFVFAFIAAGIGVLATNPFEVEFKRKIRPAMMYLYLLLVGMYTHGIYHPSIWVKITHATLSGLLAYALWQKVRDHCPYFLDPTDKPPPSISLADGLIGAQAFFVLQALSMVVLILAGYSPGASMLMAFVVAGVGVGAVAMFILWRRKVPDFFAQVGFIRGPGAEPGSWMGALAYGCAGGLFAAAFGLSYLTWIDSVEFFRKMKEDALSAVDPSAMPAPVLIAILAVLAAPIFEEFIFRGLIYRGFRRTVHPVISIAGSAAVFAVVHPPLSVIPVFFVGLLTATVFERTRLLMAPILVHMIYNAVVMNVSLN